MKKLFTVGLTILLSFAIAFGADADVHVKGYFRKNGTYVAPHYRSSPDSSKLNNWSTKGNTNPYTGKKGTKNVWSTSSSYAAPATAKTSSSKQEEGNTNLTTNQAYEDCYYVRGTKLESSCIKNRVADIHAINALKPNPLFNQAYEDCYYMRGTNYESSCIRTRMADIQQIHALKPNPSFQEAYEDCYYARGTTVESICIKNKIADIKRIEALKSEPLFKQARDDCYYMRNTNYESSCIQIRIQKLRGMKSSKVKTASVPQKNYGTYPTYTSYSNNGSGHDAGYEWAEENDVDDEDDCDGNSDSFNEGCQEYVEEQQDSYENSDDDSESAY